MHDPTPDPISDPIPDLVDKANRATDARLRASEETLQKAAEVLIASAESLYHARAALRGGWTGQLPGDDGPSAPPAPAS